jgi:hypothetical protein
VILAVAIALQQAAFGQADLTPPPGANMPGGFTANPATGVRDRLLAVACVIHDGKTPVAIVGIDSLFSSKEATRLARERILAATGIPGSHVLVGASHTHTGGPLVACLGTEADPAYVEQVAAGITAAVVAAWKRLEPSEIAVGSGREEGIAYNRRFFMRDGRVITHPGRPGTPHHEAIVRPAGPVDPEVGVLAVRRPGAAEPTGVVVNFACHCTVVGGREFSADYVAALRRHLQARRGPDFAVVFLQGACGDLTQVDNRSTAREFGPEHADLVGMKLAAEAERTWRRAPWTGSFPVAAAVEQVPVRIRPEPDAAAEDPPFGLGSGPDEVYARERTLVAEERARTPVIEAEVQALRVGPLAIATNGSEYFVEYGLALKKASRHPFTWFAGYANEYIGYVPTAEAFVQGGYEVRTARSSKLAPDAGQKLLEGALRALGRVFPQ